MPNPMNMADAKDLMDKSIRAGLKNGSIGMNSLSSRDRKRYLIDGGVLVSNTTKKGKKLVNAASKTLEAVEYEKQGITPSGFRPAKGMRSVKNLRVNP